MIIFVYDGIGPIGQDSNVVSLQILGIAEVHPIFNVIKVTKKNATPNGIAPFLVGGKGD